MRFPPLFLHAIAAAALCLVPGAAEGQEHPARRLSSIVGVAVEEYGKAVDARGKLVSDIEYREAVDFLQDAKSVAGRLAGARADLARTLLDSLVLGVQEKAPPAAVTDVYARFTAALGAEGALELPRRPVDLAEGKRIFDASCASCHGALGRGDGVAAKGMNPPPPALGVDTVMAGVTPALMYRIVSVGIAGTPMAGYAGTLTPEQRWDVVSYVNSLRTPAPLRAQGEGLFAQNCAGCHGMNGGGTGALASSLSKVPPQIVAFGFQTERSDAQISDAIRNGIPGTTMPPSRHLADRDIAAIVSYVRHAGATHHAIVATDAEPDPADAQAVARRVVGILDQSLAAATGGRSSQANDLAFDAYIAFEPLEGTARAKSPGLVAAMERHFADFKGAVRGNDLRTAERTRNAIEAGMPGIVALTRPTGSGWGAFFQSFLIILREGLEAILVVGAVVAFLIKTGHRERLRSIWIGVGLALGASAITAVVLATVLRALPATREIIEGVTMLVAVAVLFSVSYWLISKVEAAKWQAFIKDKVNQALEHGGGRALVIVAFLAVYREGAETALFYQALFNEGAQVVLPVSLGIVAGGVLLAVIFTLFYRYGVKIPLRPFFTVTSALLYYMAFVFMGKGVRELQEGNVVGITVLPGWPHVDALGIFPSVETLLAQLVLVVLFVFALAKTFWPKRSVTLPTVPETAPVSMVATPEVEARVAELQAAVKRLEGKLAELEGDRVTTHGE